MKAPFSLILFFILLSVSSFSQTTKHICGLLTDASGMPLQNVKVAVKGSATSTLTDVEGRYCIDAPVGATLVYFGYSSHPLEYMITEDAGPNLDSLMKACRQQRAVIRKTNDSTRRAGRGGLGIATLTDQSPSYIIPKSSGVIMGMPGRSTLSAVDSMPAPIYDLRYCNTLRALKHFGIYNPYGLYIADLAAGNHLRRPFIEYTMSFSVDHANRLPQYQSKYVQGSPLNGQPTWQGPESGELFSWGPEATKAYHPEQFFRCGFSVANTLNAVFSTKKQYLKLDFEQKTVDGILRNSTYYSNNASLKYEWAFKGDGKLQVQTRYGEDDGRLQQQGANLQRIMSSLYLSPNSFDPANGLLPRDALNNTASYLLPGNGQRSYSYHQANNPYWLINHMPDHNAQQNLFSGLSLEKTVQRFTFIGKGSYEKNSLLNEYGLLSGAAGNNISQFTQRKEETGTLNGIASTIIKINFFRIPMKGVADYHFTQTHYLFNRTDYLQGVEQGKNMQDRLRNVNELSGELSTDWRRHWMAKGNGQLYHSSTLTDHWLGTWSLAASFRTNKNWYRGPLRVMNEGKLRLSYGTSISEASLQNMAPYFNTLLYSFDHNLNYYDHHEIIYRSGLQPERVTQWNAGGDIDLFRNVIQSTTDVYRKTTEQSVFPVYDANYGFMLQNCATIQIKGFEEDLSFRKNILKKYCTLSFIFTRSRPIVTNLYNHDTIALLGAGTVTKCLIPGQPVGVLVGTRYLRDGNGNKVIGSDGFPLVDPKRGIIGNPNPLWTLGVNASININKNFSLNILIDYLYGADRWNGTRNVMNYYGTSKESSDLRTTNGYVFDGVKQDGTANDIAVNFYDASQPLSQNRWVRYGVTGVDEDGIEKVSYLRLREATLQYTNKKIQGSNNQQKKFSVLLFAKNFIFTRYHGVDPDTALFGYSQGAGLDLFNFPACWSVGIKLLLSL